MEIKVVEETRFEEEMLEFRREAVEREQREKRGKYQLHCTNTKFT